MKKYLFRKIGTSEGDINVLQQAMSSSEIAIEYGSSYIILHEKNSDGTLVSKKYVIGARQ